MKSIALPLSDIRQIFRPVYGFIFPPICHACDSPLDVSETMLCAPCRGRMHPLQTDDALYIEKRHQLLAAGHLDGLAAALSFERNGVLQELIHQLKYNDMTGIGIELGKLVASVLPVMAGEFSFRGLVPVPLHPTKERERGYNQSTFICRGISAVTGLAVFPHLLRRVRHTQTQTKLDAHERRVNVADAFTLNDRRAAILPHSPLLIVDDIITTGATINECARVLKQHGAEHVCAASIAIPDLADVQ